MKLFRLSILAVVTFFVAAFVSCTDEIDIPQYPDETVLEEHNELSDYEVGEYILYYPSARKSYYYPIKILHAGSTPKDVSLWTEYENTRVLPYLIGFTPNYSEDDYKARTNKYGSDLTQYVGATGRFYTYKDPSTGRWWVIDPEGYRHIQRGFNTVKPTNAGEATWLASQWGGDTMAWQKTTQEEFYQMGMHSSGAFTSEGFYQKFQEFNAAYPETPITIAPSMGWLSAYRSWSGNSVPASSGNTGDSSYCAIGCVYYDDWAEFCDYYAPVALASYIGDPNVFGFFSDNEIQMTSAKYYLLDEIWYGDRGTPAKEAAVTFMAENGWAYDVVEKSIAEGKRTMLQGYLNDWFSGQTAELYFKAISEATKKADPEMLYLGSRFHGTPKYIDEVVQAAGRHCDIISINYYGVWSPERLDAVAMWETADAPFLITEFYVKATDQGHGNTDGAGELVQTQADRAMWYQHFTLGLLESTHCIGWHWFRYMDDENSVTGTNRGFYNNKFEQYDVLVKYAKELNYNTYDLIDFFDKR